MSVGDIKWCLFYETFVTNFYLYVLFSSSSRKRRRREIKRKNPTRTGNMSRNTEGNIVGNAADPNTTKDMMIQLEPQNLGIRSVALKLRRRGHN